jgi:hypothetical protein
VTKDKTAPSNNHHTNGKLRRVASSTGSNLREVTSAAALPAAAPVVAAPMPSEVVNPGVSVLAIIRLRLRLHD